MFNEKELEEIKKYIKNSSEISPVAVGCDAKYAGKNTLFALTVGIHIDGKHGSKIFRKRIKETRRLGLREKLWREVNYTLELAHIVKEYVGIRDFEVHLDLNEDINEASSVIVKEAKAMVEANGFKVRVKPNSPFLASHCADHFVRSNEYNT